MKSKLVFIFAVFLAVGLVFCVADTIAFADDPAVTEVPESAGVEQPAEAGVETPESATGEAVAKEEAEDEDVTLTEIIDAITLIVTNFKGVGLIAGFVAIIALLVLVLRIKALNAWLEKMDWKKYKPYIAASLAAISGFLIALGSGKPWTEALAAGIAAGLAGLTATGGHQLLTRGNADKKKKG